MELLDGAQPSDIEKKILPVLQGAIASWQLYPQPHFLITVIKDYGSRGSKGEFKKKKKKCCFLSMEEAEGANLEPKAIGKL